MLTLRSITGRCLAGLPVLAITVTAMAATVTSNVPAGYLRWTLPATGSEEQRTTLNFPLSSKPVDLGKVQSVDASTVTVAGSPWASFDFEQNPSYLHFLSGAQAGRALRILSNTANTLTVDISDGTDQTVALNASGFAVAANDRFEIVPARTIANTFGSTPAELQLAGGATVDAADVVSLYNPSLLQWEEYFFNTAQSRWEKAGVAEDAGETVIDPDDAVLLIRRPGRAEAQLIVTGQVPQVPPLTKTTGGNQPVYTSTRYPIPMTFSELDFGANWQRGNNAFTADTVSVWDESSGRWLSYYQLPNGDWRRSGSQDVQNSTVIPQGTVIGILKRAKVTGADSLVSVPMPYTLD